MRLLILLMLCGLGAVQAQADSQYSQYIDSDKRIKCLYGYVAGKTGDHATAIQIFEDCIARWDDVYSMIWLAQIYESGVGVPQDLVYATELMRRGAEQEGPYTSLARYHYALALFEGKGVEVDQMAGQHWMQQAAAEGFTAARVYLSERGLALPALNPEQEGEEP
ncbi:tetratricopeptide repeat protein [Nitrincola tapanii]|uniref:Sel1 repeat family protein n=1 Tax=Nitrincola tapanii TaxID=1708751 RepID=A0A5A9W2Q9_9GAMM|nr:SEL1-like repeat protein [Nitrincola tapanii]KAA0874418.1 sel1 repeat family protein [Nitrincola tapanii]